MAGQVSSSTHQNLNHIIMDYKLNVENFNKAKFSVGTWFKIIGSFGFYMIHLKTLKDRRVEVIQLYENAGQPIREIRKGEAKLPGLYQVNGVKFDQQVRNRVKEREKQMFVLQFFAKMNHATKFMRGSDQWSPSLHKCFKAIKQKLLEIPKKDDATPKALNKFVESIEAKLADLVHHMHIELVHSPQNDVHNKSDHVVFDFIYKTGELLKRLLGSQATRV